MNKINEESLVGKSVKEVEEMFPNMLVRAYSEERGLLVYNYSNHVVDVALVEHNLGEDWLALIVHAPRKTNTGKRVKIRDGKHIRIRTVWNYLGKEYVEYCGQLQEFKFVYRENGWDFVSVENLYNGSNHNSRFLRRRLK